MHELPYKFVVIDEIEFYVHGFNHGDFDQYLAGGSLVPFVQKKAREFMDKQGSDYCCEESFDIFFGLDRSRALHDFDAVYFDSRMNHSEIDEFARETQEIEKRQPPLLDPNANPDGKYPYQHMFELGHIDVRYLPMLEKYYDNVLDMPMPMEAEIYKIAGARLKAVALRSEYIAEFSHMRAKKDSLGEMHVLCGFKHVNQVVYFLNELERPQGVGGTSNTLI